MRSSSRHKGPRAASPLRASSIDGATEYRKNLSGELEAELAPFLDEKGRPEEAYRGAIRRIETRFKRKERRAERDYVDWVLLAVSALLRDRIALSVGIPARRADESRSRAGRCAGRDPGRPRPWRRSRRPGPSSRRISTSTFAWSWNGRSCRSPTSLPEVGRSADDQLWCWHYWHRLMPVGRCIQQPKRGA